MVVAALRSTLVVGSLSLLAACSPGRNPEVADAPADAEPDAAPIRAGGKPCHWLSSLEYTPVTVTGTSPSGSFDDFHYAYALATSGFCGPSYEVGFVATESSPHYPEPTLRMWIPYPFTATGTNRASAVHGYSDVRTEMVTFEATQLDPLDASPPHIIGHFVSHEAGWSFDISVDLTSQCVAGCI